MPEQDEKIKIAIVDDHDFFRVGLKRMINRMGNAEVIAEAENGKMFIEMLQEMAPDIIMMDIKMPEMDGVTATKLAVNYHPSISVIAISLFREGDYMLRMIEAGAKGFLLKNADESEIERAINEVYKGGFYFSGTVKQII